VLTILLVVAAGLAIVLTVSVVVFLRARKRNIAAVRPTTPRLHDFLISGDFTSSNSVTILLGEEEIASGLRHIDDQVDGATSVETLNGFSARVLRPGENREIAYFYFQIHPSFKQTELGGARFDVEYMAPQSGTLSIHYDAIDAEDVTNPRYRDAVRGARLVSSNGWQTATFRTHGDGLFGNRQNGRADFRIFSKAPELYVRRVTVTREAVKDEGWTLDHSATNQVTIALGQEKPEDGLRHQADEPDGRTQIANLDGVMCRYLNRTNKPFGYLYFSVSPTFKRDGLKDARVDVEYFVKKRTTFRLQFDGMKDEARHKYITVLPERAQVVRFGGNAEFARLPTVGAWSVATVHITNAVFKNGENGDADFRLEMSPAEFYVRRVTVTREHVSTLAKP
jgi:hypothetical protein